MRRTIRIGLVLVAMLVASIGFVLASENSSNCTTCDQTPILSSGNLDSAVLTSGIVATFSQTSFKCYTCWKKVCCKGYKKGFCRGWCMGAGTCCK